MKNAVFWDVAPCRSCLKRRYGGTYRLHLQGRKIGDRGIGVRCLQPLAHAGSSLVDFSILKMEAFLLNVDSHDLHGATPQKTEFFKSSRNSSSFTKFEGSLSRSQ
jgi:hypothetical protein